MPIPDFQSVMLPLLRLLGDKQEHSLRETIVVIAKEFSVTSDEAQQLLPSGRHRVLDNRVGWACTHLKKAGLLEYTKRGWFKVTSRGIDVLSRKPTKINLKFLEQFPEFVEFRTPKNGTKTEEAIIEDEIKSTPEESLETAYQTIRNNLATEILEKVKSCSPAFFERLVVELLVKMGYGGTLQDAGRAVGGSGDGGIDGIIKEDRLGLDVIYLQAKRWEGNVSRPEVQKFAGALQGQRARKGVFITTSDFTKEARDFAAMINSTIILVNGDELAQLMIDYNVGVSNAAVYEIKKIDSDYFTEE